MRTLTVLQHGLMAAVAVTCFVLVTVKAGTVEAPLWCIAGLLAVREIGA